MELRHLRYFVAVAEELHFGRAAERLFMAQPPLSQQIKQLETEIDVRLFEHKSTGTVDVGWGSLSEGSTSDSGACGSGCGEGTTRKPGRGRLVRRWVVASAIYDVLPVILRRFREEYPNVELFLLEIPVWNSGKRSEIDEFTSVSHACLPRSRGSSLRRSRKTPLMVALPASHRLAGQAAIHLQSLALEPFILYPHQPESNYAEYVMRLCEEAGFTPRIVQKTGEIQTAVSLVYAGIGVAIVPASAHNLRREGVVYCPIAEPGHLPPSN